MVYSCAKKDYPRAVSERNSLISDSTTLSNFYEVDSNVAMLIAKLLPATYMNSASEHVLLGHEKERVITDAFGMKFNTETKYANSRYYL